MALTPKREHFARLIALEGLNQSEAYRQAYNVSPDADPQTVWVHASHLAHHAKVAPRIAELRAASQERALVSATEILEELKTVGMAVAHGPVRAADKVAALDKMAKIMGLYKETEVQPRAAITQVNIILSHGQGGTSSETHRVVDGAGRMLEPSVEEHSR